ncbi:MAG: acetylglutamate kinase, partial [Chloroflexaceae bacterium]|nr:acetylglutamate kinase [Chloroflexaceae bacterium]
LSGVDLGLLRCVPHRPNGVDLGRVGVVTTVDVTALEVLLAQGWLPVLAPVALGQDDCVPYNVNADIVAMAVAGALARDAAVTTRTELVFVSNIPGVRMYGQVAPYLTASTIDAGIASGDIHSGMIPKVQSALAALEQGVTAVRITDLNQAVTGGTCITKDKNNGNTV